MPKARITATGILLAHVQFAAIILIKCHNYYSRNMDKCCYDLKEGSDRRNGRGEDEFER